MLWGVAGLFMPCFSRVGQSVGISAVATGSLDQGSARTLVRTLVAIQTRRACCPPTHRPRRWCAATAASSGSAVAKTSSANVTNDTADKNNALGHRGNAAKVRERKSCCALCCKLGGVSTLLLRTITPPPQTHNVREHLRRVLCSRVTLAAEGQAAGRRHVGVDRQPENRAENTRDPP